MLRLWRALRWHARRQRALEDVSYNRSGLRYFTQELISAELRLLKIEAERISVDYPPPSAVGRSVDIPA
jgi:hypothetical protein